MQRYKPIFYLLLAALGVYAVAYQARANLKIAGKQRTALEEALEAEPAGHAIIMVNQSLLTPYAHARALALDAPEEAFWLVGWDQDPAIMLNYHVYPKVMRMSLDTQKQLHSKNLLRVRDPIMHLPPKGFYEKVAIIQSTSARLEDEWTGE